MKQAAHTLLGVLFIFSEFHLLRRQNPVCPREPFRQRSSGSNQKSKRSHSSPALGEFQNQGVRVRIPFPARVQFLNKTQGNGIPLGKSGHSSSKSHLEAHPEPRDWHSGQPHLRLGGRTTRRRFLEPAMCLRQQERRYSAANPQLHVRLKGDS